MTVRKNKWQVPRAFPSGRWPDTPNCSEVRNDVVLPSVMVHSTCFGLNGAEHTVAVHSESFSGERRGSEGCERNDLVCPPPPGRDHSFDSPVPSKSDRITTSHAAFTLVLPASSTTTFFADILSSELSVGLLAWMDITNCSAALASLKNYESNLSQHTGQRYVKDLRKLETFFAGWREHNDQLLYFLRIGEDSLVKWFESNVGSVDRCLSELTQMMQEVVNYTKVFNLAKSVLSSEDHSEALTRLRNLPQSHGDFFTAAQNYTKMDGRLRQSCGLTQFIQDNMWDEVVEIRHGVTAVFNSFKKAHLLIESTGLRKMKELHEFYGSQREKELELLWRRYTSENITRTTLAKTFLSQEFEDVVNSFKEKVEALANEYTNFDYDMNEGVLLFERQFLLMRYKALPFVTNKLLEELDFVKFAEASPSEEVQRLIRSQRSLRPHVMSLQEAVAELPKIVKNFVKVNMTEQTVGKAERLLERLQDVRERLLEYNESLDMNSQFFT